MFLKMLATLVIINGCHSSQYPIEEPDPIIMNISHVSHGMVSHGLDQEDRRDMAKRTTRAAAASQKGPGDEAPAATNRIKMMLVTMCTGRKSR